MRSSLTRTTSTLHGPPSGSRLWPIAGEWLTGNLCATVTSCARPWPAVNAINDIQCHRRTTTMLRHMMHQEHMLAVRTHYGPLWIIRPTGHAIGLGGTAQLALLSESQVTSAIISGQHHYQ